MGRDNDLIGVAGLWWEEEPFRERFTTKYRSLTLRVRRARHKTSQGLRRGWLMEVRSPSTADSPDKPVKIGWANEPGRISMFSAACRESRRKADKYLWALGERELDLGSEWLNNQPLDKPVIGIGGLWWTEDPVCEYFKTEYNHLVLAVGRARRETPQGLRRGWTIEVSDPNAKGPLNTLRIGWVEEYGRICMFSRACRGLIAWGKELSTIHQPVS